MVLGEEFFPSCAAMGRDIDVVRVATKGNANTLALPLLKRRLCQVYGFDFKIST